MTRKRLWLVAAVAAAVVVFGLGFAITSGISAWRAHREEVATAQQVQDATADIPSLKRVLAQGVDVNARDGTGWTALHLTAMMARTEAAEVLLNHGADPNAKNNIGNTPLHTAVGLQVDHLDEAMAFLFECVHRSVAELLLQNGADVNARNEFGASPLHLAASLGYVKGVRLLLDYGADVDARTESGDTPLNGTAWDDRVETARELIEAGAEVGATDNDGLTPLFIAAKEGSHEVALLLINYGADVNAQEPKVGLAPLHAAAGRGHVKIVKLLLARGADVKAITKSGYTPSDLAAREKHTTVLEVLPSAHIRRPGTLSKEEVMSDE